MVAASSLSILTLVGLAFAHPGHEDHVTDMAVKRSFLEKSRRSLDNCAAQLEARGTLKAAEESRARFLNDLRKKSLASNLHQRDTASVLNKTHYHDLGTDVTPTTDPTLFFVSNKSCILSPEGEIGPFWVSGELNRTNIAASEPGVINYMHAQFIDIATCSPLPHLWWDVWSANSTGVYSGVQDSSNGNGDDASNLNNTALRGIQETDEHGIASFRSIFPGHYGGRATHVHVVGHVDATLLSNGTITGGSVAHIGQMFFDQELIAKVEALEPYNTNQVEITTNEEDRVLAGETEGTNSDPVFEYMFVDQEMGVEGGIFSWVTIGVDTSATYNTSYAALLTAEGGVANGNSGGGGGEAPNGVPSGVPSGVPTMAA